MTLVWRKGQHQKRLPYAMHSKQLQQYAARLDMPLVSLRMVCLRDNGLIHLAHVGNGEAEEIGTDRTSHQQGM